MSFQTMKRFLEVAGALATLTATMLAYAAPQDEADLPMCEPAMKEPVAGEEPMLPPCEPEQAKQSVAGEEPMPPEPVAAQKERKFRVFNPRSVSLATGAGPSDYFGRAVETTGGTNVGATWDVRATFGARRSVMALEAGYMGSVNKFEVPGNSGNINSNGLDGTFRLQLPTRVQPYVFGGLGWNFMSVDNGDGNPAVTTRWRGNSNQLSVPAGGGVAGYFGEHVTVDVRGTYKLNTNQDITVLSGGALHQWIAQARLGYVF